MPMENIAIDKKNIRTMKKDILLAQKQGLVPAPFADADEKIDKKCINLGLALYTCATLTCMAFDCYKSKSFDRIVIEKRESGEKYFSHDKDSRIQKSTYPVLGFASGDFIEFYRSF